MAYSLSIPCDDSNYKRENKDSIMARTGASLVPQGYPLGMKESIPQNEICLVRRGEGIVKSYKFSKVESYSIHQRTLCVQEPADGEYQSTQEDFEEFCRNNPRAFEEAPLLCDRVDSSYEWSHEIPDSIPLLRMSNYEPSERLKRQLMLKLYGAIKTGLSITIELMDTIASIILLAPPAYDNTVSTPVFKYMSDIPGVAYKTIELKEGQWNEECARPYHEVTYDEPFHVGNSFISVNDVKFVEWFTKKAPVDDALSYFAAICILLLECHAMTNCDDVVANIETLTLQWSRMSPRSCPRTSFLLHESDITQNRVCPLLMSDRATFQSLLKMIVLHYLDETTKDTRSWFLKNYKDYMVVRAFAYQKFEVVKAVDTVIKKYRLNSESLMKFYESFNNELALRQLESYILTKKKMTFYLRRDHVYQCGNKQFKANLLPYSRLLDDYSFDEMSPEEAEELYALSLGLVGEPVPKGELSAVFRNLHAEGKKRGSHLRERQTEHQVQCSSSLTKRSRRT